MVDIKLLSLLIDAIQSYVTPHWPDASVGLLRAISLLNSNENLDDKTLSLVASVASEKSPALYNIGTEILNILLGRQQSAKQVVLGMSQSKLAHVRRNAILCLSETSSTELVNAIIGSSLQDKSSLVRQKAADWAGRLNLLSVVERMEEAVKIENHPETRKIMLIEIGLIRDGYYMCPADPAATYIYVRLEHGPILERVENSVLEEQGIERIVEKLRGGRPQI